MNKEQNDDSETRPPDSRWVVWWFEVNRDGELQRVYQDFPGRQTARRFYHRKRAEDGQFAGKGLVSAAPWHHDREGRQS